MAETWYGQLGMQWPIVQAGMGGGPATSELAIAVSRAGGLGTIGLLPEAEFAAEIDSARKALGGFPFAANLLLPMIRRGHIRTCIERAVPVVSLFFGHRPGVVDVLHQAGSYVMHQVGSPADADRAVGDGADALIVQGVEAGGHVWATRPLADLLPEIRAAHPDVPVLAAGGIHDAASVRSARDAGADGVNVGTRFLLTPESHAHTAYKHRLLEAEDTLLTRLFGLGWDAPHRVCPNAATERWCRADGEAPRWLTAMNAASYGPSRLLPLDTAASLVRMQKPSRPFFSPFPLSRDMPEWPDTTALYAGQGVAEMQSLQPAKEVVAELAGGFET